MVTTVVDRPDRDRYVVEVDGVEAGFTIYRVRHGDNYFFPHTEIYDEWHGSGVGSVLVREALDDVAQKGGLVVPICPFVWSFIQSHPEYDKLINHDIFDRIAEQLHQDG